MTARRTIVVGDIHGCLEEFDELLRVVEYERGRDRLVLLGDLVDRGPDSAGVVRRAIEVGAESVLGNHEEWHLRYCRYAARAAVENYKNPMKLSDAKRAVQETLRDAEWEWIERLPNFLHLGDEWTALHAGCAPGLEIERQKPYILRHVRFLRRGSMQMAQFSEPMTDRSHAFWAELWMGPRSIFYGHYVDKRGAVLSGGPGHDAEVLAYGSQVNPQTGARTLGLDTGCCFGGALTAAMLDGSGSVKVTSVYARDKYASVRGEAED